MSTYKNKKITFNGLEYTLGERIGAGGNGEVYSATTENDTNEYAVKILVNFNEAKKQRFLNEINFCEKCHHKNVLKVLGHSEFKNKPCYIMQRFPKTLKDIINDEQDYLKLLLYSLELCEAVQYVHEKNIIHRDIKPENIFIDKNSNIVLADFGISHFDDSTLTKTNEWLGNKSYAAPEQLLKGKTQSVTKACDIYAVGAIINEMFTKEKPSGSKFRTISEIEPILSTLDDLIYRCMLQNPIERPTIDEILIELKLIYSDIEKNFNLIRKNNIINVALSKMTINQILKTASKDLLSAKQIFERVPIEELKKYNINYHTNIRYTVSSNLKCRYFQKMLYRQCMIKFNYESHAYYEGNPYTPLNLNDPQDQRIFNEFKSIVDKYKIKEYIYDNSGQILKIFSSCCDYHCKEIITNVLKIEKTIKYLNNSSIIYIVCSLREVLSIEDTIDFNFIDHVYINWKTSSCENQENDFLYNYDDTTEKLILTKFKNQWNAIYSKINFQYYSVKFKEQKDYELFKNFALKKAKPYYIFEGDVLNIIRIKKSYNGIIELEPWNTFDITNVLAKILGFRTDY